LLLRAGALALIVLAFPFYTALANHSINPTTAAGPGRHVRDARQRHLCRAVDRSLSNGGPLQRRRVGIQHRVHAVQRHGAARRHESHSQHGLETAPAFIMVACGLLTLIGSVGLPSGGHVLKTA
jgi:hypothetical protein